MKPGITFHTLGSVKECEGMNPTLPSELPLGELESQWTPKSLENDCRGLESCMYFGNILNYVDGGRAHKNASEIP